MDLLLDTHVWIWAAEMPEDLGRECTAKLTSRDERLFVSTISSLEIARLLMTGKISLKGDLSSWVAETLASLRCETLPLTHDLAIAAYQLPGSFHPDPADRILVGTARTHDLVLLTADHRILGYPHVRTLDARR